MGAAELLRVRGGLVAQRRGVGCGRRAGGGLGVRRRGRGEERAEAQRGNRAGVGGRTCAASKVLSSASVNRPIFLRVGQLACLSGSALLSAGCCEGKVRTGDGCWVELDERPLTRSGVFSLDDLI